MIPFLAADVRFCETVYWMTPLLVPLLPDVMATQLNDSVAVQLQLVSLANTVMFPAPPEYVNVACCGTGVKVHAVKVAVTLGPAVTLPRVQTPVPVQTPVGRLIELLHPVKKEPVSATASRVFPATGACVTPSWHGPAVGVGLQLSRITPVGGAAALQFTVPVPNPPLVTSMVKA